MTAGIVRSAGCAAPSSAFRKMRAQELKRLERDGLIWRRV
jgi:DNA-binding HxlR family transcriptional regulator